MNNDFRLVYYLTVIPGYHFLIAMIAKPLHLFTIPQIRVLSFLISFLIVVPTYFFLVKRNIVKTNLFVYFPLMFFYYGLIYTDIISMGVVLLAFLLLRYQRYYLSSMIAFLSLLIRQNNIIWILFFMMYIYFKENNLLDILFNKQNFEIYMKKVLGYIVCILWFGAFIFFNKGITLGDRGSHAFGFYLENVFIFLIIYFFMMFPEILESIKRMKLWIYMLFVTSFSLFSLSAFRIIHPYNTYAPFIHNTLVKLMINNFVFRVLGILICALVAYYFFLAKFEYRTSISLFIASLLILVTTQMVEFRYYFIIIALIFILMEDRIKHWRFLMFYYAVINIIMAYGILTWQIFW